MPNTIHLVSVVLLITLGLLQDLVVKGQDFPTVSVEQAPSDLRPVCGDIYKAELNATTGRTISLMDDSDAATLFYFDCFSVSAVPKQGWKVSAECDALADLTQTEMTFTVNDEQGRVLYVVPLDLVFGGSISSATWPLADPGASVSIQATVPKPFPVGCSILLYFTLSAYSDPVDGGNGALVDADGPWVRSIYPGVAVRNKSVTLTFLRPKVDGVSIEKLKDQIFFVKSKDGCDSYGSEQTKRWPAPVVSLVPSDSPLRDANAGVQLIQLTMTVTFVNEGGYYICSIPYGFHPDPEDDTSPQSLELGYLQVFGGNPAYYEILGVGKDGLKLNTWYTIAFTGVGLDTRPGKDTAKLVDADVSADCSGAPAFGVEPAADLGPNDDYGSNVTKAYWRIKIKQGGYFLMCYRRFSRDWVTVSPLEMISKDAQSLVTNTSMLDDGSSFGGTWAPDSATSSPTYLHYTPSPDTAGSSPNGNSCKQPDPGFTYDPTRPAGRYVTLEVSKKDDLNRNLVFTLSSLLCVPTNNMYLSSPVKTTSNTYRTKFTAECTMSCDTDVVYQYLIWLQRNPGTSYGAIVRSLGIVSATPQNGALFVAAHESEAASSSGFMYGVVALLFFMVIGLIVGVVVLMKRRARRQGGQLYDDVDREGAADANARGAANVELPGIVTGRVLHPAPAPTNPAPGASAASPGQGGANEVSPAQQPVSVSVEKGAAPVPTPAPAPAPPTANDTEEIRPGTGTGGQEA